MKRCSTCKQDKPLAEFYRDKARVDGLNNRCKACCKEANRAWRAKNPEHARRLVREADARYREKTGKSYYNEIKKYKKYGLNKEKFDILFNLYNGKCHICKDKEIQHVDHCHETNIVRGLLCHWCNTGIGLFLDDPCRLQMAITYLQQHLRSVV